MGATLGVCRVNVTAEKWWSTENATSMVNGKTGKRKSFHFQERQAENLLILTEVGKSLLKHS